MAGLREAELRLCDFEVLMVDDRPWRRTSLRNAPYWVVAAAVNYAYAARFGYRFRVVRPHFGPLARVLADGAAAYPGWHKVMYVAERLRAYEEGARRAAAAATGPGGGAACAWLLYLDGDAFVREQDLPLPTFLAGLGARYAAASPVAPAAVFAREQPVAWLNVTHGAAPGGATPKAPFLNTGVFLVRAAGGPGGAPSAAGAAAAPAAAAGSGGAAAAGTERPLAPAGPQPPSAWRLFREWLRAAAGAERRRLWTAWPGEQGVLSELVRPGSYPEARLGAGAGRAARGWRRSVLVVNMTEMNSPWGNFVQHSWGKEATEVVLRARALGDALLRLGAAEPRAFRRLVAGAQARVETWEVWPHFEAGL